MAQQIEEKNSITAKRVKVLRVERGCTQKDIAEALGITPNAARVRLHRAKKRFLEAMKSQL